MKLTAIGFRRGLARTLGLGELRRETRQGHVLLCVALWAAVVGLLVSRYGFTMVVVDGESMAPSLRPGNVKLVHCWKGWWDGFHRGDVVVIRDKDRASLSVKRIIGLPGDSIQLKGGAVYRNGQLLQEPYTASGGYTYSRILGSRTFRVCRGSYFVLGDNRLVSEDSRWYGDVDGGDVLGTVGAN